jgi:hypothetical protein
MSVPRPCNALTVGAPPAGAVRLSRESPPNTLLRAQHSRCTFLRSETLRATCSIYTSETPKSRPLSVLHTPTCAPGSHDSPSVCACERALLLTLEAPSAAQASTGRGTPQALRQPMVAAGLSGPRAL